MTTSQAPSANFVTMTIRNVIAVAIAPMPLTAALRRAFRSLDLVQCITIPAWDKVNARKAPTAKRGMSLSVTPLKKISKLPARTVSTTMPCVYTSRRPRTANNAGRNPSCDTVRQTRGKSANEVLADRQSTRRIAAIVT